MLGPPGNLSLSISSSGRFVIKLTTESWPTAIDVYGEYFNMLYGEKYIGFQKLAKIRKLVQLEDTVSRVEAIKLVYTLADSGKERKMTLDEKLLSLNLSTDNTSLSNISFTDNNSTPSFLFMLGLLIPEMQVWFSS